jgi:transcriptional regulator with XRE-family HTH domain
MGPRTENPIMNPTQAKRFGTYLRRARERAELSQARLAKLVGADNTRIMRLEAGITLNPAADFLSDIADVLGLDLFEVYEKAGYAETGDLPSFNVYLRSKYGELPESATEAITSYAERLAKRHGVDLSGPAPGEDELPDEQPKTKATSKKGGTSHAKANRPNQ